MSKNTPKFCAECGGALLSGAKFCPQCGGKVAAAAAPETAAPAAANVDPVPPTPAAAAPAKVAPVKAKVAPAQAPGPSADPLAALLGGADVAEEADDQLGMPDAPAVVHERKRISAGWIAMGVLGALVVAIIAMVASDDELNARFQCSVLGQRKMCETDEDRAFKLEQVEKKEEMELMGHHYGSFDLRFTPEKDTSVAIVQRRYEEGRESFVKRIRDGGEDNRSFKIKKVGAYTQGKSGDGQTHGIIAFKENATAALAWQPTPGKELVLPMTVQNLPLLEKEQVDGNGKRLTADDVAKLEKLKDQGVKRDEDGNVIVDPNMKVRTTDISTWTYEVQLTAPGYKPRSVLFYEPPNPPDTDVKKLEAEGWTVRKFKRTPEGKFLIDNASFDLLPEPKTIRTRYIQVLKELYCMKEGKEYQGKTEQGKADAEALIWEQKAFSRELVDIAHQNDADPEFIQLRDTEMKGYQCPKMP